MPQGQPVPLGILLTRIMGTAYYQGRVAAGEAVRLVREPDNRHDRNAIRVENHQSVQVGHLPRELVAWLAPLVDQGKVRCQATVSRAWEPDPLVSWSEPIPLRLTILPGERAGSLFQVARPPQTPEDLIHRLVVTIWKSAAHLADPRSAAWLAKRLYRGQSHLVSPASLLLCKLLPWRVRVLRSRTRQTALAAAKDTLQRLVIGTPRRQGCLTIFPLSIANGHERPYLLLDEAVERGQSQVREASESGTVERVRVENLGRRPVLLPEGEVLIGAKQDRMVSLSLLVGPSSSVSVPVCCVERGRWSYASRQLQPARAAPPTLRAVNLRAARGLAGARSPAAQAAVWDEVRACLTDMQVQSETESIADAFKAQAALVQQYRRAFELPASACGVVVARGERIVALDLFDSPETFGQYAQRLTEGYALEAARADLAGTLTSVSSSRPLPAETAARRFIDRVRLALRLRDEPVGMGVELEMASEGLVGSGVCYRGRLCHLSAFAAGPQT